MPWFKRKNKPTEQASHSSGPTMPYHKGQPYYAAADQPTATLDANEIQGEAGTVAFDAVPLTRDTSSAANTVLPVSDASPTAHIVPPAADDIIDVEVEVEVDASQTTDVTTAEYDPKATARYQALAYDTAVYDKAADAFYARAGLDAQNTQAKTVSPAAPAATVSTASMPVVTVPTEDAPAITVNAANGPAAIKPAASAAATVPAMNMPSATASVASTSAVTVPSAAPTVAIPHAAPDTLISNTTAPTEELTNNSASSQYDFVVSAAEAEESVFAATLSYKDAFEEAEETTNQAEKPGRTPRGTKILETLKTGFSKATSASSEAYNATASTAEPMHDYVNDATSVYAPNTSASTSYEHAATSSAPSVNEAAQTTAGSVAAAIDPTTAQAAAPDPNLLLGRYKPEGQAGVGGFASVIAAWDTRIQRRVAIKCLPLENTTGSAQSAVNTADMHTPGTSILMQQSNFNTAQIPGLEEARTAAMLSDANIVQVYDFEVQGRMAYLILEYIDGMSLADLLDRYAEQIDPDIVAVVFKAVAHGLEVAHKHSVLHLDIKPENVLINHDGQVKVVDFGLARLAGEAGWGAATGGTIGYMPPEQMRQKPLNEQCDEWALASLTYEMIAGENPFIAETLGEAEDAIYETELVIPSLCMDGLDESIDDILFCALDPNVEGRYDSVKDFATQLQPCLGSVRKGQNKLKALMTETEPTEEEQTEPELQPVQNEVKPLRIPGKIRNFGFRAWAALNSILLGLLAIQPLPLSSLPLSFETTQIIGYAIPLVFGVVALFVPHVGVLLTALLFGGALIVAGNYLMGAVFVVLAIVWWMLGARGCLEAPSISTMPVLFGAIFAAPFTPFVAGYVLSVRKALAATAFAFVLALTLACFGSLSITGWDIFSYGISGIDGDMQTIFFALIKRPSTWITFAAWMLAALVASLCCSSRKRFVGVLGMIVAAVLIVAAPILTSYLTSGGTVFLSNPLDLVPLVLVSVMGIILPLIAMPARSRR